MKKRTRIRQRYKEEQVVEGPLAIVDIVDTTLLTSPIPGKEYTYKVEIYRKVALIHHSYKNQHDRLARICQKSTHWYGPHQRNLHLQDPVSNDYPKWQRKGAQDPNLMIHMKSNQFMNLLNSFLT